MKSWAKSIPKIAVALFLLTVSLFLPSVNATDAVYTPKGMGITYNGSDDGWIMAYEWTAGSQNGLRVAFSADRPYSEIGRMVGLHIRTDGYYSRDCGWWYNNNGASVKYVWFHYPNGTVIRGPIYGTTDGKGIWTNKMALKITDDMPMGTYKVNATVYSGAAVVGDNGNYMTIFFDVGGPLYLTVSANTTFENGHWKANKSETIRVSGKVLQPNGDEFNSTTVPKGTAVTVRVGVSEPNASYEYFTTTTTNGDYTVDVPLDQVGSYFLVVSANATVGGSGGIKYAKCEGRNQTYITARGQWPENSFSLSPIFTILVFFMTILLLQGGVPHKGG